MDGRDIYPPLEVSTVGMIDSSTTANATYTPAVPMGTSPPATARAPRDFLHIVSRAEQATAWTGPTCWTGALGPIDDEPGRFQKFQTRFRTLSVCLTRSRRMTGAGPLPAAQTGEIVGDRLWTFVRAAHARSVPQGGALDDSTPGEAGGTAGGGDGDTLRCQL